MTSEQIDKALALAERFVVAHEQLANAQVANVNNQRHAFELWERTNTVLSRVAGSIANPNGSSLATIFDRIAFRIGSSDTPNSLVKVLRDGFTALSDR
jgi:hypothetical protein